MKSSSATIWGVETILMGKTFPWWPLIEGIPRKGLIKPDSSINLNKVIITYDSSTGLISSLEGKYGVGDTNSVRIDISWNSSEQKAYFKFFRNTIEELRLVGYFETGTVRKLVFDNTNYVDTSNTWTAKLNIKSSDPNTIEYDIHFLSQHFTGEVTLGDSTFPSGFQDFVDAINAHDNCVEIGALCSEFGDILGMSSWSPTFGNSSGGSSTYRADKFLDKLAVVVGDLSTAELGPLASVAYSMLVDYVSDYILEHSQ